MIDNMRDWIKMVEEMIEDEDFDIEQSNNSEIKDEDTVYRDFIRLDRIDSNRGANIPKSTVICMISCHQEIMTTDEIPKSFKSYITDIVFQCCLDLYQHDDGTLPQKYGELMISCIETEANNQYSGKKYRQETKQVYRTVGMNTGVRHELIVKDMKMTDLVDRIDGILEYHS